MNKIKYMPVLGLDEDVSVSAQCLLEWCFQVKGLLIAFRRILNIIGDPGAAAVRNIHHLLDDFDRELRKTIDVADCAHVPCLRYPESSVALAAYSAEWLERQRETLAQIFKFIPTIGSGDTFWELYALTSAIDRSLDDLSELPTLDGIGLDVKTGTDLLTG